MFEIVWSMFVFTHLFDTSQVLQYFFLSLSLSFLFTRLSQRSSEKSRLFTLLLTYVLYCWTDDLFIYHIHCFKTSSSRGFFLLWKLVIPPETSVYQQWSRKRRTSLKTYRIMSFSLSFIRKTSVFRVWISNETISNEMNVLIIHANNLTYMVEKVTILDIYTLKFVEYICTT